VPSTSTTWPHGALRIAVGEETRLATEVDRSDPLDVWVLPRLVDNAEAGIPTQPDSSDAMSPDGGRLQRMFDVVAATGLLIVCAPLFLLIWVLFSLTRSGPLFYRQTRIGRNGKPFEMLKFRSMHLDAERTTGPVFAVTDDPRCTRLGKWLRWTCCDELPQLINVLRGEMRLVGPRPEREFFVDQFRHSFPLYDARHSVKPGITGWAQIKGLRGNTPIGERLRFDLEYVHRRSFWFDLLILFRTPAAILWPKRTQMFDARTFRFPSNSNLQPFEVAIGSQTDVVPFEPNVRRAA
jgi:lipopolysaccharide/colanic/teichoic acid biosynthesis glycosyltransferase